MCCLEGEIGFSWRTDPIEDEKSACLTDVLEPKGQYVFKVLRPGDAMYMPPGMVRFVFRRPGGGQAMGSAAQMLGRADVMSWLECLWIELGFAIEDGLEEAPYAHVVPQMIQCLCHLMVSAIREGNSAKFGGRKRIEKALQLTKSINDLVEQLR